MTTNMNFNPFGGPAPFASAKGVIPFVGSTTISGTTARYFGWGVSNTNPAGLWFLAPGSYSFCRVVVKVESNTTDGNGFIDLLGGDPATDPTTWTPISRVIIPAGSADLAEREGVVSIPKGLGLVIRGVLDTGVSGGILSPHGAVELS